MSLIDAEKLEELNDEIQIADGAVEWAIELSERILSALNDVELDPENKEQLGKDMEKIKRKLDLLEEAQQFLQGI